MVFLDAAEHRWVEELGGLNVFFVFDDGSMITPPLHGTILSGITRDSILTLARATGLHAEERRYSIYEWRADAARGRLREAFACGTAAVISGIGEVRSSTGVFPHQWRRTGRDHSGREREAPVVCSGLVRPWFHSTHFWM